MIKSRKALLAMAALPTSSGSTTAIAETRTISAIVPWQGQGQLFPIAVDKLQFLGALEGIMYVETADGDMNEAFVRCPIVQYVDGADRSTSARGNCVITVSPEDAVFAEMSCEGVAGLCSGDIKLTGGTGRFEGVSGSGKLTVRSPVHALAADLSDGTVVQSRRRTDAAPRGAIAIPTDAEAERPIEVE